MTRELEQEFEGPSSNVTGFIGVVSLTTGKLEEMISAWFINIFSFNFVKFLIST